MRPDEVLRVGVAYPFPSETLATLQAVSPRLSIRSTDGFDQAAIDEVADDGVDILIGQQLPGSATALAGLSWLQVLSAGVDHVLASGRLPGPVTLTNARGAYAGSMSQFAISALLRTAEPIVERLDAQANARWPDGDFDLASRRLRGRTLVLIGYGSIAREVARVSDVLGLRILAVKADPDRLVDDSFRLPGTGDPEGRIPERAVGIEGIHDAVSEADYVLITLPGTSRSKGLVDAEVIAAMPSRAWVINIGRGSVIDEPALVAALQAGAIAGAVLVVFAVEPLPAESALAQNPKDIKQYHHSVENDRSTNH